MNEFDNVVKSKQRPVFDGVTHTHVYTFICDDDKKGQFYFMIFFFFFAYYVWVFCVWELSLMSTKIKSGFTKWLYRSCCDKFYNIM